MAGDPVSEAELEEHRWRRPADAERDQPAEVEPGPATPAERFGDYDMG